METQLTPDLPTELQVEVTGACNLRCRMCLVRYRPPINRVTGSMCLHTFAALVDDLPRLEKITLQGLGEPLLAPDLFAMIEYATARNIRVGFNTNGTLLTKDKAERLIGAGLSWLHVSVDGATKEAYEYVRDQSNFERVRRNVIGLVDTKRRMGAVHPRLSLVFVAMRTNIDELPDLVRLTAEWGVRNLWVQNLSHSFSDTDPAGEYREIRDFTVANALFIDDVGHAREVFDRCRVLADELGVDLRLPHLAEHPAEPELRQRGLPGCSWPWESSYVTHDGNVQPCCMVMGSDRAVLGNVDRDRFAKVWTGDDYRRFRRDLLGDEPPDVCRGCSMYRGLF